MAWTPGVDSCCSFEEQGVEMIVDHEAEEELRRAAEEALGEPKSAPLGPAERAKNAAMRARGAATGGLKSDQ